MALQTITHNTSGPLNINASAGLEVEVTVNANITSQTFTNTNAGDVINVTYVLGGGTTHTINFAGYLVVNNWASVGTVSLPAGQVILGVFVQHTSQMVMTTPSLIGTGGVAGALPAGGDTGEALVKNSASDSDVIWHEDIIVDLTFANATNDGVTDDSPALKAFIDTKYAEGKRVFQFPPRMQWVIDSEILFDGYDNLTFIAYGAEIKRGTTSTDFAMFKFLRCTGVTWLGGSITGRRALAPASYADDGERFMHFRSGSKHLTVRDATFYRFGGNLLSITAENTLFADLPSPTPVDDGQIILDGCRVYESYGLGVTKGGGISQGVITNCHFFGCVMGFKVDGEQERQPAEHADYGPMGNWTIANCTGQDMITDAGDAQAHMFIVTEDIIGACIVDNITLDGSTGVALFGVTKGQTDRTAERIVLSNSTAINIVNTQNQITRGVSFRGATKVVIRDCDFHGCGAFITDSDGPSVTRSDITFDGCNFYGERIKVFKSDITLRNTHFYEDGSGLATPIELADPTDSATSNGCWWDPAYTSRHTGSGALQLGPGDWEQAGTTGNRPSTTVPGQMWFDTTLNQPIWRNTANTGWVDSTGTAV